MKKEHYYYDYYYFYYTTHSTFLGVNRSRPSGERDRIPPGTSRGCRPLEAPIRRMPWSVPAARRPWANMPPPPPPPLRILRVGLFDVAASRAVGERNLKGESLEYA